MSELFFKHKALLEKAVDAVENRYAWTPFIESPSRKLHPEGARENGKKLYESFLKRRFPIDQPAAMDWVGEEVSPFTGEKLQISYPQCDINSLIEYQKTAQLQWQGIDFKARIGIGLEILDRLAKDVFCNAYCTQNTAGQSFMMSFAGSGANSLDRGLEAIAFAYKAMSDIPQSATFERRFGGQEPVKIKKNYRLMPRGIAVVITCGSYPAWNAYPSWMANMVTGNPVMIKPHPMGVLPMARAVQLAREVIQENGLDPNMVCLIADRPEDLVTKKLIEHSDVKIVDFTGSAEFGGWIERNCPQKLVYTETAGCNAVVVESTDNYRGMLHAIAQSLSLFSAQMCTAAQNIFVSEEGVKTDEGLIGFSQFAADLVETIDGLLADPEKALNICGCLQNKGVIQNIERFASEHSEKVLRESNRIDHPSFHNAQTATPLVLQLSINEPSLFQQEHFGPVAFVIKAKSRVQALEQAASDAKNYGSIANYAYTTDESFLNEVHQQFALHGASVGCNLIGHLPINFTAAFSDYHVTGLNPAGNACLTDLSFVTNRFRIVQNKTEVG